MPAAASLLAGSDCLIPSIWKWRPPFWACLLNSEWIWSIAASAFSAGPRWKSLNNFASFERLPLYIRPLSVESTSSSTGAAAADLCNCESRLPPTSYKTSYKSKDIWLSTAISTLEPLTSMTCAAISHFLLAELLSCLNPPKPALSASSYCIRVRASGLLLSSSSPPPKNPIF